MKQNDTLMQLLNGHYLWGKRMQQIRILCILIIALVQAGSFVLAETRASLPVSALTMDEDGLPIIRVTMHSLKKHQLPLSYRFLLDTGASTTVLDHSIPDSLFWSETHPSFVVDAVGVRMDVPRVVIKRIEVAGICRDDIPAVRMDLKHGHIGRFQDDPVDGILGMSFLQETRFVLDIKKGYVKWWESASASGVTLPITYNTYKLPHVTLKFEGHLVPALLDTAMTDGLRLPLGLCPSEQGREGHAFGLSGTSCSGKDQQVSRVEAGTDAWQEVPVYFQEGTRSGAIGMNIWSEAPVCYDFVKDLLTLERIPGRGLVRNRSPNPRLPVYWDRSGKIPRLRVFLVKPGSSLDQAKARPGDEIIRAGPLEKKSLNRRALQGLTTQGKVQPWTVRRDGVLIELQVPSSVGKLAQPGG